MTDAPQPFRVLPCGDAAVSVEFGERIDRAMSAQVLALDEALAGAAPAGVIETAPTFRSLFVRFDPRATDADRVEAAVVRAWSAVARGGAADTRGAATSGSGRRWRLPFCADPAFALDLKAVAERAGLTEEAVLARHLAIDHYCYMLGFLPGAPYLGDGPEGLDPPRMADPRVAVPAGSVALAVGLTTIYPVTSPGGWSVIGRTPTPLFEAAADPPALIAPGDVVRFEPLDLPSCERLQADAAAGAWRPTPERL